MKKIKIPAVKASFWLFSVFGCIFTLIAVKNHQKQLNGQNEAFTAGILIFFTSQTPLEIQFYMKYRPRIAFLKEKLLNTVEPTFKSSLKTIKLRFLGHFKKRRRKFFTQCSLGQALSVGA